jgi:hypothetical protein
VKKKNQICHRAMLCQYMYKPWNIEYWQEDKRCGHDPHGI